MAKLFEQHTLVKTFEAGGAISEKTFVKLETSGDPAEVVTCGAGEVAIGVALDDADEGDYIRVLLIGVTTVVRGETAVTAGKRLVSGASGVAVPMGTGAGTYNIIGTALGNPAAEDEEFPALIASSVYVDTDTDT